MFKANFPIVIVDDEEEIRRSLAGVLQIGGFKNLVLHGGSEGLGEILSRYVSGILLLDLNMPGKSGKEILPELVTSFPEFEIIVVTGNSDLSTAVECIKNGAFDYLLKPLNPDSLINCVNHALELRELRAENTRIRERLFERRLKKPDVFSRIKTGNERMLGIFQYCEAIAPGEQAILISGETGTGKELIARAIHDSSGRNGEFVAVNIAGLESNMLNATLFGHVKGAFTGAGAAKKGLVEQADEGTLFLDEIGDLSSEAQIKLLRLLQEREFFPVGSTQARFANLRVLAATHMDLDDLVERGEFRKDLYYRLITHYIHIPPLRERQDDIELLLNYFLLEAAEEFGKIKPNYPPELVFLLKTHSFPGNIRELRAMAFNALSSHQDKILSTQQFRLRIKKERESSSTSFKKKLVFPEVLPTIKQCVNDLVDESLRRTNQNQKLAAELLGVSQQALNKRLKRRETE